MAPTDLQRQALCQRPEQMAVMRQRWSRLLFAHWSCDPVLIQATLPQGLYVDTFEGRAWLGIVPFYMERIRPVLAPPLPWLSWFLELNVRTYVHDGRGRAGVWFYSLDCNQPVAVLLARNLFHLPYQHARMRATHDGEAVDYTCQRSGAGHASRYRYRPAGEPGHARPGTFEYFLLERYLLFSTSSTGSLHTGRVYHTPYPFMRAEGDAADSEPLRQAGFGGIAGQPESLLYSPGVEVSVYPLQRLPA